MTKERIDLINNISECMDALDMAYIRYGCMTSTDMSEDRAFIITKLYYTLNKLNDIYRNL